MMKEFLGEQRANPVGPCAVALAMRSRDSTNRGHTIIWENNYSGQFAALSEQAKTASCQTGHIRKLRRRTLHGPHHYCGGS